MKIYKLVGLFFCLSMSGLIVSCSAKVEEKEKSTDKFVFSPEELKILEKAIKKNESKIKAENDILFKKIYISYGELLNNFKDKYIFNSKDIVGFSFLIRAWGVRDLDVCELVLKSGANPNEEISVNLYFSDDNEAYSNLVTTPIEMSLIEKDGSFCKLLLKYKADKIFLYKSKFNLMMLGVARKYKHQLKGDQDIFYDLAVEGKVKACDFDSDIVFGRKK